MDMKSTIRVLIIAGIITLVGNTIFTYRQGMEVVMPWEAAVGMVLLGVIVVLGLLLAKAVPIKIPSVAYIALIGILLSIPGNPVSDFFLAQTAKVQFLALCTPVLAYAGVSIGKDIGSFAKLGPKIVVVALLVFTGTFLGSAVIAQLILKLIGEI